MRLTALAVFGCAAALVFAQLAHAQQRSAGSARSTSNGLFGSRTVGSGTGSRSTMGQGQGQGQGNGGLQGTPGNRTTEQQQGVGSIDGSERFSRENRGQFIGADSSDSSNFYGEQATQNGQSGSDLSGGRGGRGGRGQTGRGGLGGLGGSQGRGGRQGQFGQQGFNNQGFGNQGFGAQGLRDDGFGNNGRSSRPLRPQLTVGFAAPVRVQTAVTNNLEQTMDRLSRGVSGGASAQSARRVSNLGNRSLNGNSISVSMEGRTAVLSGTVASEHDRVLAERLALLEPGVSAIRNELVVASANAPTAAQPTGLPAPAR
jgi:hypothetical protein